MDIIKPAHMVKTRKDHRCHGCCNKIPKGSEASSFTGKEDEVYTIHMCPPCATFANAKENREMVQEIYENDGAVE